MFHLTSLPQSLYFGEWMFVMLLVTFECPGMIIGENAKQGDLEVNPVRAKAATNMRTQNKDEKVYLAPPKTMTVEELIGYMSVDEVIEGEFFALVKFHSSLVESHTIICFTLLLRSDTQIHQATQGTARSSGTEEGL